MPKITKNILPFQGSVRQKTTSNKFHKSTSNKYIKINGEVPYVDTQAVEQFLLKFPTPMEDGQSGIRRYRIIMGRITAFDT